MQVFPIPLTTGLQPLPSLLAELRGGGVRFNPYAERMLEGGWVEVASEPTDVLVEVHTVGALGWADGAPLDAVLDAAAARGLAPCPLEVALLLRRAWRDCPVSPRITVASRRVRADETLPRGFYLRDDADGCWLRGYVASDDWLHGPDERLALQRRPSP